jgi:hypothetical protein
MTDTMLTAIHCWSDPAQDQWCGDEIVWRRCGDPEPDGVLALDLWCPHCQRRVWPAEINIPGPYAALRIED